MIYLDTETKSGIPLKWGMYRYMQDADFRGLVASWALDQGPVYVQDFTARAKMDEYLEYLIYDERDEPITCHNAMFDRNALHYGFGVPKEFIPPERFRCTMVRALAHGLPGGLEVLGHIMGVAESLAKNKDGKDLIKLFCMPRPKNSKLRWATPDTHPEEWARFVQYGKDDIPPMRELDRLLPRWNYDPDGIVWDGERWVPTNPGGDELMLWHLDQRVNDRGMLVDVQFAERAVEAVKRAKKKLADQTEEITDGAVMSTNKRDQLLAYILAAHGVELPDMRKDTIERRLMDDELPDGVKELLRIRLQESSNASSKYLALTRGVMADGRLRGTQQFNGAARTRRAAGRMFQPQNLTRPTLSKDEIDLGIEAIKMGYEQEVFENVVQIGAQAVRGVIIAPPGKKLVIADLSNIEGRCGGWQGGEDWKMDAFKRYDTFLLDQFGNRIPEKDDFKRIGHDLYKIAYGAAFVVDPGTVDGFQRQIGKVMELMLQYEGGVGAFVTGAATYRIDLDDMADRAWPTLPDEERQQAERYLAWVKKHNLPRYGLSDKVFIVCDTLKRLWRKAHPGITSLWPGLRDIVVESIQNPGVLLHFRKYAVKRSGSWLRIRMPSGKYLCYLRPEVSADGVISYMGVNQYTRKWQRITTYGGKLFENATQALAGDILKAAEPVAEEHGYEIVLTVHDELVTEAPDSPEFNAEHLSQIMVTSCAEWTKGMPLSAAGFETYRYRKG